MQLSTPHGLFFEEYAVGQSATTPGRTITEADIVAFAGLSGDYNEIHTNEHYPGNRFGKRIAHGLLGLSIASGLAFQLGFMRETVEAFRGLDWEFTAPIFIGDSVRLTVEITDTKAVTRLGMGKVSFRVSLMNQTNVVVQRGNWHLLVKLRPL